LSAALPLVACCKWLPKDWLPLGPNERRLAASAAVAVEPGSIAAAAVLSEELFRGVVVIGTAWTRIPVD
jgi:hypothetical protein